jgi:thiamine monophosphate kinase
LNRLYDPAPRLEAADILRDCGVTVAGDLSDGIYREVERLTGAFGLGGLVRPEAFPLEEGVNLEQVDESEDFELICAASGETVQAAARKLDSELKLPLTPIGSVVPGPGIFLETRDGRVKLKGHSGYEHFGKV